MITFAMAHFIIDIPYTYVPRELEPLENGGTPLI